MIRATIANGEIEQAQEQLQAFFAFIKEAEQELYQQMSRTGRLNQSVNQGTISQNLQRIEENQINSATIACCSEIEQQIQQYFPELNLPINADSLENQLTLKHLNRNIQLERRYNGDSAIFFRGREAYTDRLVMIRVLNQIEAHIVGTKPDDLPQKPDKRLNRALNLKHRNVIKVLGADLTNFPQYVMLEYIKSISLDDLIGKIPFSLHRAVSIFTELGEALYHLHINGIVHQNVKPDKVLIDHELRAVISPFDIVSKSQNGQANWLNADHLLYAAPELLKGEAPTYSHACDQFSLAVVAYELLTGKPLFGEDSLGEYGVNIQHIFEQRLQFFGIKRVRKERLYDRLEKLGVPKLLQKILANMLAESPDDRYVNMRALLEDLRQVQIDQDPVTELVLQSYERCCVREPEFTQKFYQRLFSRPEMTSDIINRFPKRKSGSIEEIPVSPPIKMLRVAIDLIIHSHAEPTKLKQVLSMSAHEGLDPTLYEPFIDTIIDCARDFDYLLKLEQAEYQEDSTCPTPIQDAWAATKNASMEILAPQHPKQ